MTTSEPNEQPPTIAPQGPTGEPLKPARSRRGAGARPAPPPPPEAPIADGDETRPIAIEPEAPSPASAAPVDVADAGEGGLVSAAAAAGLPPYREAADTFDVFPPAATSLASRVAPETVYVPLAVSIGDGFKFGCGFFLALVMAMLVGFVLLALLFVLSTLVGLNLPITR